MTNHTKYSAFPYLDDYFSADVGKLSPADKNRVKILFRPSRSVQVREMNSLQSQVQTQIARFGNSIYQNGTRVIDGTARFASDIRYVDIDVTDVPSIAIKRIEFISGFCVGRAGNAPSSSERLKLLRAKILNVDNSEIETNVRRIYFRYQSAELDNDGNSSKTRFEEDDELFSVYNTDGLENTFVDEQGIERVIAEFTSLGKVIKEGRACAASVDKGIYYANGYFINVEPTRLYFVPIEKDTNENIEFVTGEVRFFVKEEIVTFVNDERLLDNATQQPNYAAPGADRVELTLQLIFIPDLDQYKEQKDNPFDDDFKGILSREALQDFEKDKNYETFKLLRIENSEAVIPSDVKFSNIEKREARRIFERDGDYVEKQYPITKREAWNELRGGKFDLSQLENREIFDPLLPQADKEEISEKKFLINLGAGISYVNGRRNQLTNLIDIFNDKARRNPEDIIQGKQEFFGSRADNYILVNDENFDGNDFPQVGDVLDITEQGTPLGEAEFVGIRKIGDQLRVYVNNSTYRERANPVATHFGNFALLQNVGFTIINPRRHQYKFETTRKLAPNKMNRIDCWVYYTENYDPGNGPTLATIANDIGATSIIGIGQAFYSEDSDIKISPLDSTAFANGSLELIDEPSTNRAVTFELHVRFENFPFAQVTSQNVEISQNLENRDRFSITINGDVINILEPGYSIIDKTFVNNAENTRKGLQSRLTIEKPFNNNPSDLDFSIIDDDNSAFPLVIRSYQDRNVFREERHIIDFRSGPIRLMPNRVIKANYDAFGGRIDYVVVNDTNDYFVVQGEAAEDPVPPRKPDNTLVINRLEIPPFTYNVVDDVGIVQMQNQLYKTPDIANIEHRVSNLEYYVSVNALEQKAIDEPLFDDVGERFKNGILVDNFVDNGVVDFSIDATSCSFDREAGLLYPKYVSTYADFKFKGENNRVSRVNNQPLDSSVLTVDPVESIVFMEQLYGTGTVNVNPYEIGQFYGSVELSPHQDIWFETERLPDIIVEDNSQYDALKEKATQNNTLGVEWGSWTVRGQSLSVQRLNNWQVQRTLRINEERVGTETFVKPEVEKSEISDTVLNVRIIPKMRSRKIYIKARGLKPNTKHFLFFDEQDLTDYTFKLETARRFNEDDEVTSFRNKTSIEAKAEVEILLAKTVGDDLVSDSFGDLFAVFVLPQTRNVYFSEGTHTFKLTASEENNDLLSESLARTEYSATGRLKTRQRTVLATKTGRIENRRVVGRRTRTRTQVNTQPRIHYTDPLAQTFIQGVNERGGIFMESVDIWFSRKDPNNIPVTLHLVEVENGIPTQRILPGSQVTLRPSEVNATNERQYDLVNGATTFVFDDPIYIAEGEEYAMVLISPSLDYEVWYAVTGDIDPTRNEIVAQNPFLGVMLKSQNASTWTPVQDSNLMFRARCYQFDIENTKTFKFPIRTPSGRVEIERIFEVPPGADAPTEFVPYIMRNISESVELPNTTLEWKLLLNGGAIPQNRIDIKNRQDIRNLNGIELQENDELELEARLSSNDRFSTPLIDTEALAVFMPEFQINNDVEYEEFSDTSDGGAVGFAEMRYITRRIELRRPADKINIWFDSNRPAESTNIKFYIKYLKEGEFVDSFHSELEWVEMDVEQITVNSNEDVFSENSFEWEAPKDNANPENDEFFTDFAIKIVYTSPERHLVPKLRNVRIVATS